MREGKRELLWFECKKKKIFKTKKPFFEKVKKEKRTNKTKHFVKKSSDYNKKFKL